MPAYYPTPFEILTKLGMECILVGSATTKPLHMCKDVDFVVSAKGVEILQEWEYYLDAWEPGFWYTLIPFDEHLYTNFKVCVDFFHGLCKIEDKRKWKNRITYEEACLLPLRIQTIDSVDVLSL